ncbi:MAG: hypothetical protein AAF647_11170, partial [Pseudomonadota bacterium]
MSIKSFPQSNLPTGAEPTPDHIAEQIEPFDPTQFSVPPACAFHWPDGIESWKNFAFGDCVTAEEAFAKAADINVGNRFVLTNETVVGRAYLSDALNSKWLTDTLGELQKNGFRSGGYEYRNGTFTYIQRQGDTLDIPTLQTAIANKGPVKIAMSAGTFGEGTGSVTYGENGWLIFGGPSGKPYNHCVSICGYGSYDYLKAQFQAQGVTLADNASKPAGMYYALFT